MIDFIARPTKNGKVALVVTINKKQKAMIFNCDYQSFSDGLKKYRNGSLVQEAFRFLSAGEREFLISGTTPGEWSDLFAGGEY